MKPYFIFRLRSQHLGFLRESYATQELAEEALNAPGAMNEATGWLIVSAEVLYSATDLPLRAVDGPEESGADEAASRGPELVSSGVGTVT